MLDLTSLVSTQGHLNLYGFSQSFSLPKVAGLLTCILRLLWPVGLNCFRLDGHDPTKTLSFDILPVTLSFDILPVILACNIFNHMSTPEYSNQSSSPGRKLHLYKWLAWLVTKLGC